MVSDPDLAALSGLLERLSAVVRRLPAPGDLSLATAATLNTLSRYGPVRLGDLAHGERVTQPGMTQLVARLERDGLAERHADPGDRRVVLVAITAQGERLVQRRRAARREQIAGYTAALGEGDRRRLAAALPALERLAELGEQDRTTAAAPVPA